MQYEEVDCIYNECANRCFNENVKPNIFGIRHCPVAIANGCNFQTPKLSDQKYDKSMSQEFDCKCGKASGWISDKQVLGPCPECGRRYHGKHNKKTSHIDAIEIRKK